MPQAVGEQPARRRDPYGHEAVFHQVIDTNACAPSIDPAKLGFALDHPPMSTAAGRSEVPQR